MKRLYENMGVKIFRFQHVNVKKKELSLNKEVAFR